MPLNDQSLRRTQFSTRLGGGMLEKPDEVAYLLTEDEVISLTASEVEMCEAVIMAEQNNMGDLTPIPQFIADILALYAHACETGKALTIEQVQSEVEDCRLRFHEAIAAAKRTVRDYPIAILGADKAEALERVDALRRIGGNDAEAA